MYCQLLLIHISTSVLLFLCSSEDDLQRLANKLTISAALNSHPNGTLGYCFSRNAGVDTVVVSQISPPNQTGCWLLPSNMTIYCFCQLHSKHKSLLCFLDTVNNFIKIQGIFVGVLNYVPIYCSIFGCSGHS